MALSIPNLTKKNAKICVLTDFEPDDMIALYILFRQLPKDAEILMIVGEGLHHKTTLAVNFCKQFHLGKRCTVTQGDASGTVYPSEMLDLFDRAADGSCLTDIDNDDIVVQDIKTSLDAFDFTESVVLALKPFNELLCHVDASRFESATLALYGSFNLKQSLTHGNKEQVERFLNNTFTRTILYETFFATGQDNSVNRENSPTLFGWLLQQFDAVPCGHEAYMTSQLRAAIRHWNRHIAADCAKSIALIASKLVERTKKEDWRTVSQGLVRIVDHNAKALASIARSNSMQMVLADFALVACLFPPSADTVLYKCDQGWFSFGNYNRSVHTVEQRNGTDTGRVFLVRNVDRVVLDAHIVQLLTA